MKKAPPYYTKGSSGALGVSVVSNASLANALRQNEQTEWCTRVRIEGLQLLLWYCVRQAGKGFCVSGALAAQYVSVLKRPKSSATICNALPLLCRLGFLARTHPSVRSLHVSASARYKLHPEYAKVRHSFTLSERQKAKVGNAEARREQRLNRRYPVRAGVLASLQSVRFAGTARPKLAALMDAKPIATKVVVQAIDGLAHSVSFDTTGQITTSISSLPRELKSDLLFADEEAVFVDVSNAHHCFLPTLLRDRIGYHQTNGTKWATCFTFNQSFAVLSVGWNTQPGMLARLETERARLIEFLSDGDYYAKIGPEGEERNDVKSLANIVLNVRNEKARRIPLYRLMRKRSPATFGVLEDIKRKDHRKASTVLRHHIAKSVELALLDLHRRAALKRSRRPMHCCARSATRRS